MTNSDLLDMTWRTSSRSGNGGECVEVAVAGGKNTPVGLSVEAVASAEDTERLA